MIEFCPGIGNKMMTVIATVHLKEGVNEILVTSPLAEYMSGVSPRVESNYKLYWMDMDAIILTEGLALDVAAEAPGIETTDIEYAQLSVKKAKPVSDNKTAVSADEKESGKLWLIVGISALAVLVIAGTVIALLLAKRKKKA